MGKKRLKAYWDYLDELEAAAGSVQPKKDGSGKYWQGGHETTRREADGSVSHYRHSHTGGRGKEGWNYDPKTGRSKKF